jgi:hypothetical protein
MRDRISCNFSIVMWRIYVIIDDKVAQFMKGKVKLQACKPDSVEGLHLSVFTVTCGDQAAYPVTYLINRCWTCRPQKLLYVAFQHARFTRFNCYQLRPWALTPRFHPHRCFCNGSYFLWHLLSTVARCPAIHRCTALCCPDFPTMKTLSKTWPVAIQS